MGNSKSESSNSVAITGSNVTGATANLSSSDNHTVDLHIAAPVFMLAGAEVEKFDIANLDIHFLGIGLGVSIEYDPGTNLLSFSGTGGAFLNGEGTVSLNLDNLDVNGEGNLFFTLETGAGVSALGVGAGLGVHVTLDENQLVIGGNLDVVVMGITTENIVLESVVDPSNPTIGPSMEMAFPKESECFAARNPIDMWPLDTGLKPGPDGLYNQAEVLAKIWRKPVEQVKVGDIVVSFDDNGSLVPGRVPRTMVNEVKILLNFHGTRVTPGHVYFRPDSQKADRFETLIDILRDDGVIENTAGEHIRAATNIPLDDPRDGFVWAVTGPRRADGTVKEKQRGRLRLGTRFIVEGKRSYCIADLVKAGGGTVGTDEMICVGDGPPVPFHWEFGATLPKPEDYVLECSGATLEDIYRADEWEEQPPHMPAPMVLDKGPVQPLSQTALFAMTRNEPLTLATKPHHTPNRKQRKALAAMKRKALRV